MRATRTSARSLLPALALGLLLVVAVGACGSDDGDGDESTGSGSPSSADDGSGATEPAPAPEDPLLDRTFVATSITEGGEEHALVEGTELRITVTDDQFSVNAGCNTMAGGYTLTDDQLALGEMGATMMGCDDPLAAQDQWLADVLARPGEVAVDGEEVTLTFGDTVLVMTELDSVHPPAELVGTTWQVDTLVEGTDAEGSASSVDPAVGATLTLSDDGTYAVSTGCNTGGGGYQVDEGASTIRFELPRLTRMGCTDEAAQAVEAALMDVLDGEATYEISEERLTLTDESGGVGFRAG